MLREIRERQEAVAEILSSDSSVLLNVQALLKRLPDLERGICSIYHKKVFQSVKGTLGGTFTISPF